MEVFSYFARGAILGVAGDKPARVIIRQIVVVDLVRREGHFRHGGSGGRGGGVVFDDKRIRKEGKKNKKNKKNKKKIKKKEQNEYVEEE